MFHVYCPRFRGFMTWDELGCLARAVGFPTDLFKSNLTKHVTVEEHGMSVEQVNKMLDLRLLQQSIHRTRNLHTGEWNTKVIRKALYLMDHHAMTFEELYNTRIAYKAFEGNDMRGMMLDERIMLSALKMCGRSIAPLKMMHRIKHMSVNFEEPDRMQLFEFLDLVLWANLYEDFTFDSMEQAEGKEGDLFKLVDFDKLLSHHDKKLADRLNNEYLQEEWDFGHETLGDKSKFKEPPVVCGESRIQMAREQKLKYRYLKSELIYSHRKLYRAKAGYIRDRPVTAPDLSMYEEEEAAPPTPEFTAQTAYEIVQRKVKSANASVGRTQPVLPDRPHIPSPKKIWTAKAVSDAELEETQKNYEQLKFDIETVQGRFDFQKNKEIEYYFPGQLERLTKLQEEKEESESPDMFKKSQSRKPKITQKEVDRLAYPQSRIPPSHAKICDARFRGWHNIKNKKGSHFVLVAPSYANSYTGRLKKKLVETCNAPVKKVKGDFVHRYTKKSEVDTPIEQEMRPYTAPANLQAGQGGLGKESDVSITGSPADSCKTVDTGYGSIEEKLGDDSSAENLEKTSEIETRKTREENSQCNEQKQSFPKPFEKQKVRKKTYEDSEENERKKVLDLSKSEKPKMYSGSVDTVRPKTSVEPKNKESLKNTVDIRQRTSLGAYTSDTEDQKLLSSSDSKSSQKDSVISQTVNKNGQLKNGLHKNLQNHMPEKQSCDNKSADENTPRDLNQNVDISLKVENYKKELNKVTTEKRNNQKKRIKSAPQLNFTFTSFLNNSEEYDESFTELIPKEVTTSKSAWFEDDLSSSPDSISPRMPEPTIYIKPKKEIIDIENLPIPHLEHTKPKTVHVGAIGKISLLESITESKFWEDMIEETSRSKKEEETFAETTLGETSRSRKTEETIVEDEVNVSSKENESTKDDYDDNESVESGIFEYEIKPKSKSPKKKQIITDSAIDYKLMKAKEDRLKRQKRVLKSSSNFQKMGITVVSNSNRENKKRTSSVNSTKDLDSGRKEKVYSKSSSNSKMKEKDVQNKVNIEITDKEKLNISNNSKIEEKQKKFSASMKRLVKRMDGSMSTDMRSKMLSTRLTCN